MIKKRFHYSVYQKNGDIYVRNNSGYYPLINDINKILKFLQALKKIGNKKIIEINKEISEDNIRIMNSCIDQNIKEEKIVNGYIYLIKDKNTGLIKIGYSIDPKYRERTLQSEKPTIHLIYKKIGSYFYEDFLHNKFRRSRIRGEWFKLNDSDIQFVKSNKWRKK